MRHRATARLVWAALTLGLGLGGADRAAAADQVTGLWLTENGRSGIDIEPCGNSVCGKVVWLLEPNDPATGQPKRDGKNPHKPERNRPLCGLTMLSGFSQAKDGSWEDGTIYDPVSGKTYSAEMRLEGEKLRLRGYVGLTLFGETQLWSRLPADKGRCTPPPER